LDPPDVLAKRRLLWQVRISRKRILESATKVFEMYGTSRAVLEIEYFGEVGTGLGPTLEFYTMLSHDMQRKGLGMWRGDDSTTTRVATGLRPPL
jgi:E3 ubiquitin-protein ligase TRIP12